MRNSAYGHGIFLTVLLALLTTFSPAQNATKLALHFDSGSDELTAAARSSIDSLIQIQHIFPANCVIKIVGYTDSVGSQQFNENLSMRRSNNTAAYFQKKGFRETIASGKAENNPVGNNGTESGKYLNRRVEITFTRVSPKVEEIAGVRKPEQVYKVESGKQTILEQPSGTRIVIPENAFVDKDGKPVTGKVDFAYTEYRNPMEFILSGIPMTIAVNGVAQPFNSAGMFRMNAFQNGEPLFLAPGKNIDVEFALTQDIPDLNFYRFDSLSNKWTQLNQLTDNKGVPLNPHNMGGCGGICGHTDHGPVCLMNECEGINLLIEKGPEWTTDPRVFRQAIWSDSIRRRGDILAASEASGSAEIIRNENEIKNLDKDRERKRHQYKVHKSSSGKGFTVFDIRCNSDYANEITVLKKISWQYPSEDMTSLNDSLFKKKWDSCEISYRESEDLWNIKLTDYSTGVSVRIEGLKLVFADRVKKKARVPKQTALVHRYDSAFAVYQYSLDLLKSGRDSLAQRNLDIKASVDSLALLQKKLPAEAGRATNDSLFCFYSHNKPYMGPEESKLDYRDWLVYFDQHRPEMQQRYRDLKNSALALSCKQRIADEAKAARYTEKNDAKQRELENFMKIGGAESNLKKGESISKTKAVFRSLSVSSFGVYNCDQVYQMQNPIVNVRATYEDQQKKPLNIILVYLIDAGFNGIIRYDGLGGMFPEQFQYSAASKTTLVAFDENFIPYTFGASDFAKIGTKGGNISYTFQLKKLATPN